MSWLEDVSANRYIRTYFNGFVDLSGGDVTVRNGGNVNLLGGGSIYGATQSMVGLGNVDNTSDLNKPISTATQIALNLKANLAGPTFTGTPAAPTATAGTNTTQIATTAFTTTALSSKANLASPTFTGTPAAPTATAGTNTTQIATTAFTTTALSSKANLASPTFTGIVNFPTFISFASLIPIGVIGLNNRNYRFGVGVLLLVDATASDNLGIGDSNFISLVSGNFNTALGFSSLTNLSNGSNNTALGQQSGSSHTTGNSNTYIGDNTTHISSITYTGVATSGVLTASSLPSPQYTLVGSTITGTGITGTVTITAQLTSTTGFSGQEGTYQLSNAALSFTSTTVTSTFPQTSNSTCLGAQTQITQSNQITIGKINENVRISGQLIVADCLKTGSSIVITANTTIILPSFQYISLAPTTAITITLPTITSSDTRNGLGTKLTFRRVGGTTTVAISFIGNGSQNVFNTINTGGTTAQALMPSGAYIVNLVAMITTGTTYAWYQI